MGLRWQHLSAVALPFIAYGALAATAAAQQPDTVAKDSVRSQYLLDIPAERRDIGNTRERSWPAMNIQTPSGYGARWGDWFFGAGYQNRARYSDIQDGAVGGGFGLGNPAKYLALEVDIVSTSTIYQHFLKNDLVGFKLSRYLPGGVGIALGWDDALHTKGTDAQSSVYVAGSRTFFTKPSSRDWFSSVTVSLGAGNGRFRAEADSFSTPSPVNAFGSVGLRVAEPLSVISEWNGQDLTLGFSLVPFASIPFVITPAVTDLTGHAGDGARFIIGAGFGFSFASVTTNNSSER